MEARAAEKRLLKEAAMEASTEPGWDIVELLERMEKLGEQMSVLSNGLREAPSPDAAAALHETMLALQKELAALNRYFSAASPAELYDIYDAVAEAVAGKPRVAA
jgi:hypothetical protein